MTDSFTRKQIRLTFQLTNNEVFAGTQSNTLTLDGLRVVAQLKAAGALATQCNLQVFGVAQAIMNQLTMLAFKPLEVNRNNVLVESNDGTGWVTVFTGQIVECGPEYSAAPDVLLRVLGVALYYEAINPAPPSSYTGPTDVAVIVQNIVTAMGKTFENNGVQGIFLDSPYLPNTLGAQLDAVVAMSGIEKYIDGDIIAIAPAGQPRKQQTVLLSASTGLIGYPTIDTYGVHATCIFNTGIKFGGPVQIQSDVPKANGVWRVYELDATLESEKPGGVWMSTLGCSFFDQLKFEGST